MSTPFADAAWPACLSALRLDRWLASELPPAEAEEVREHVAGCGRCGAAADALRAGRDAPLPPLRASPDAAAALRPSRARGARWAVALASGLAAAAALVLVTRPADGPRERTKGGAAVGMWVQHGEAVRRAGPGDVVAPGDAVRFTVSTPAPAFVAILSLDPAGRASIYFPPGPRAERVDAGIDVALPLATRLDATVGREQVVGLFCDHPAPLEPARAALERGGEGAPPGCQETRWAFEKR